MAQVGDLGLLASRTDNSWMRELVADPETDKYSPNKKSREVRSGHYVRVRPTPLKKPQLVAYSPEMAAELGLTDEACRSEAFVRFFSGDVDVLPEGSVQTWATPYALSIGGQEMYSNCPFGNGNGYGDGRAISVGEVVVNGKRWEMQLKGAGTTPFARSGDGRAVLRSSIREFLASEAMNAMGVETTRALSLIVSQTETAQRGWYSNQPRPKLDDAQLAELLSSRMPHLDLAGMPVEQRREIFDHVRSQFREMDKLQVESCAITCRVAPSFLRVGHVELHGRRAKKTFASQAEKEALELIVKHALMREYPEVDDASAPLQERALRMCRAFAERLSKLIADWIRVGYCQGNFNSDNCLVGGRTMDYGPFGFVERYEPFWNMWTGGGEKYSFRKQPQAAHKNFFSFVDALKPMLDKEGLRQAQEILDSFPAVAQRACNDMWRDKLGLAEWDGAAEDLFKTLDQLLTESAVDWTVFWRQLAELPAKGVATDASDAALLEPLAPALYNPLGGQLKERWLSWLRHWLSRLRAEGRGGEEQAAQMRATSPKYVPREWMLVEAYTAAERGDYSVLQGLYKLLTHPFDEQPEFAERYYRKTPASSEDKAGTAFMS